MLYDEVPIYDLWEVKCILDFQDLPAVEEILSQGAEAVLTRSLEEGPHKGFFEIQSFFNQKPSRKDLEKNLFPFFKKTENSIIRIKSLPKKNWLKESYLSFKPVSIGKYYIYGSHIKNPKTEGKISLMIDASTAFGSGEHQTTKGCLMAMGKQKLPVLKALDLGCGSGILAMAYAKTYQSCIDATDIDPESVRVAQQNIQLNGLKKWVHVFESKGFEKIKERYHFIFANILARPLIELAPDMKAHTFPDALLILSGFLENQESDILTAYQKNGFTPVQKKLIKGWETLVLKKGD